MQHNIKYHHGITTINEPLEDNSIKLKSDTVIGILVDSGTPQFTFDYYDFSDATGWLKVLETQGSSTFAEIMKSNPDLTLYQYAKKFIDLELIKNINPTAKVVMCGVPSYKYLSEQNTKRLLKQPIENILKENALKGLSMFLESEIKFGVIPSILIAPGYEDLEVTKSMLDVANKLNAFVYADLTSGALFDNKDEIAKLEEAERKKNAENVPATPFNEVYGTYASFISYNYNKFKMWHPFLLKNPQILTNYIAKFKEHKNLSFIYPHSIDVYSSLAGTSYKTKFATIFAAARSATDAEFGWHKSMSNIEGLFKNIRFIAPTTDKGDFLPIQKIKDSAVNDADLVDSLNEKGVLFFTNIQEPKIWGSRTTYKVNDDYIFETYTRTEFKLKEIIAKGIQWAVDKPLTAGLVNDVVNIIEQALADLVTQGKLLGAKIWVKKPENDLENRLLKEQIKQGAFSFNYKFTPVPPLEQLHLRHTITGEYIDDLIKGIK